MYQPYSVLSLLSHGIILGVLTGSFVLMSFAFAFARTRLHLTVLFFNAAGITYAFTEGIILICSLIGNPVIGRQFHRIQALSIVLFMVLVPALIEVTVQLPMLWKKINRLIFCLMLIFATFLIVTAFMAPDLFISIDRPFQPGKFVSLRWAEVRGQPGFLYHVRDFVIVPSLFYMLGSFLYQFMARRGLRYILLPIVGLLCAIIMGFLDILLLYSRIKELFFMRYFSSFTSVGITLFIVLCQISVMRRYRDETREIENARKIESLGALAGGIAHDFNNLLTAIMGYISLASVKVRVGSEEHASLEEAMNASIRAKDLAGELLSLSRGGEPKMELISLRALLEGARSFVPPEARLEVVLSVDPKLKNVYADKAQISQILQNLVVNASEAMGNGGRLEISAANTLINGQPISDLAAGEYVKLVVRDSGPGIRKPDQARLFDPFFTTKGKGHGLGLTVTRRIVTLHSGAISIDSREGAGAAFIVYLPSTDDMIPPAASHKETEPVLSGRVLYLEDEDVVASVGKRMLGVIGFMVDTCTRGEDVPAMYERAREEGKPYTFVLLDALIAEGKGGIETAEDLRRIDPGLIAAATSGYSDGDLARNYAKYGFNAFLPKPFRIDDLKKLSTTLMSARSEGAKS